MRIRVDIKEIIQRSITALILGSLFWVSFFYAPPFVFSILLILILAHILVFEWKNLFPVTDPFFWLIMPLYPIMPFIFLIILNQQPVYQELLLLLFTVIACADIGGYIFGNLFGKHKIALHISPGKTWEGFIGGCMLALSGALLVLWHQNISAQLIPFTFFVLIICTLGTCGDMFESWLKRRANIKDSGRVLPGHGGFLDRFDGILFGAVFVYLVKDWIVQILR